MFYVLQAAATQAAHTLDWGSIIGILLGSSVLSTVVNSLINRKKNNQEVEFNYQEKLEIRIEKLEKRLDKFELRDNIYTSATACANGCKQVPNCPVLDYLKVHPVPDKE